MITAGHRRFITMMLLAAAGYPSAAQRLDGCPEQETRFLSISSPSAEALDRGLRDSGVAVTRDGLAIALGGPRADIRSLAALRLEEFGQKADLAPLMRAWAAEKDNCTKAMMGFGLEMFVPRIAFDDQQRSGGQSRIAPFQGCTASEPPLPSLAVEPVTGPGIVMPAVRISARNQTPQTLVFVMTQSPTELFSATVLGPTGTPASVNVKKEPQPDIEHLIVPGGTMGVLLAPQQAISWIWWIGDEFDVSAPGTYRVSLGGRIGFLDTTVCSNILQVTIGNP